MVNAIAVIPARGGSTRVPRKNVIDFMGKPIIAYTIDACLKSEIFDKVIVSTDDEEIAEISKKYGAQVPFLRDKYADNMTPVSKAVLHAVNQASCYWGKNFDTVAMAMANCPIRDEFDIKNAYKNFVEKGYNSQISCFKFGFMNPWWALKLDNGTGTRIMSEAAQNARSQDLEDLYCPTGAIWIAKYAHLNKYKNFYGDHKYFEINWKNAVDIDNYEDLEMAKAVYLLKNKEKNV